MFFFLTKRTKSQDSKNASLPHGAFALHTVQNRGLHIVAPLCAHSPTLQQQNAMPLPTLRPTSSDRFRPKLFYCREKGKKLIILGT
jgi:hypothetical protein